MGRTHLPCPDCGSSDALADYDTYTWCYSCSTRTNKEELEEPIQPETLIEVPLEKQTEPQQNSRLTPLAKHFPPLTDRGIDSRAAERFQVRAVLPGDNRPNISHVYPYFDQAGNHVANKLRTSFKKGFFVEGALSNTALFGQQAFPPGGKYLLITEGECDAMAAYQMFGHKYPVVSVKNAATAVKDVLDNYDYVTSFDEIVLCFDNDKDHHKPDGTPVNPGQDAAEAVAKILPLGKVRMMVLTEGKDANEYLQKGLSESFQRTFWNSQKWSPVGLRHAEDLWEEFSKKPDYDSVPYPWEGLNELTYGIRLSELVTITAHPKVGKTSILREVIHSIIKSGDNRRVGLMFLEEPNRDTLLGLASITANKPLHLPDVREKVSEEEMRAYFDMTYGDKNVVLWDHFGSNRIDEILNYVRYMAALGCKYVILDHLSIVVSDQSGDERKQLDEITTKLKQLTIELNIAVLCVIHQNRKGEIRGTAGVEQLSNIVIKLYRDRLHDDPEIQNTMKVSVEYNRFCGRSGTACWLKYDPETGRLHELSPDIVERMLKQLESKKELEEW